MVCPIKLKMQVLFVGSFLILDVCSMRASVTDNASVAVLGEGDSCEGPAGLKAECGGLSGHEFGSEGHVCCRKRSKTIACQAAKEQMAVAIESPAKLKFQKDQDRQCIKLNSGSWKFFRADHVEDNIPKTPDSYHENMQGMIWMDQSGYYGLSQVASQAAPDAALTFGDTREGYKLGEGGADNKQKVSPFGGAWTWLNNANGYHDVRHLMGDNFYYVFEWLDDFKQAKIHINAASGVAKYAPGFLLSFDMVYQPDYANNEPLCKSLNKDQWLAEHEDKKEEDFKRHIGDTCAKWKRRSWLGPLQYDYYVFEIVDKNGRKTFFWDKYLEYVNSKTNPDATKAIENGIVDANVNGDGVSLFMANV